MPRQPIGGVMPSAASIAIAAAGARSLAPLMKNMNTSRGLPPAAAPPRREQPVRLAAGAPTPARALAQARSRCGG